MTLGNGYLNCKGQKRYTYDTIKKIQLDNSNFCPIFKYFLCVIFFCDLNQFIDLPIYVFFIVAGHFCNFLMRFKNRAEKFIQIWFCICSDFVSNSLQTATEKSRKIINGRA